MKKKEIERKLFELKLLKAKLPLLIYYPEFLEREIKKLIPPPLNKPKDE